MQNQNDTITLLRKFVEVETDIASENNINKAQTFPMTLDLEREN
jgi:hypothetical protein